MFDSYINCLLIILATSVVWNLFCLEYFGQHYINLMRMAPRWAFWSGFAFSILFGSLVMYWCGVWYFYAGMICIVPYFFALKKVLSYNKFVRS